MNDAGPSPACLLDGLAALLDNHPHIRHLIVGYSGGLDSHVLLHLLATNRACWPGRTLAAVYVDHGLQTASASWGEHCAHICHGLDISFRALRIDARPLPGESPEAAARRARYAALAAELEPDAALLTAHHRDDQAETLLLQLLRGAGPHGLAAMPTTSRLGPGWLLRPLLEVDRSELLDYALEHGLRWIEDVSNADTDFDRNYLRHRILPLLRERWPAVGRNLARSAQWCAETADWLDADADADLARVAAQRPDTLHIPALRELSEPRQRNALRRWLRRLGLPVPDAQQLRHILHDALTAARDRQPCIRWPGGEVRRYRDTLYALPPLVTHDARQTFIWRHETNAYPPLDLPGLGTLRLLATFGEGLRAETLAGAALTIRFRQGGERFRPVGRHHSQELKKLLQEAGIPPWKRDRLPLIYLPSTPTLPHEGGENQGLLAVVGLGIAAEVAAGSGEPGFLPVLQSPSATGFGIL
ncbi:tRNA lysidine(34) synthetase TilS [Candidatus Competibacter phosphatis]|uniref:tRNA(Ile)-lysidine synthase n=1 Tax=Candidatus Competibacter phosphatis TaxID=221280 RepID=A0ABX1TQR3_9GAMM|nr:tRNA lysidine(34) synthetase TilS [Candidatus Competibacter phosphatis]NMQ20839.1 tRNA lysidine(34) synthetase TilS [Candidatus Competibacter phosphatis]